MWATSVQTQVRPEVLNRIHAYDVAGSLAMMPVGQALAGPAAGLLGTDVVLVSGGLLTLVVGAGGGRARSPGDPGGGRGGARAPVRAPPPSRPRGPPQDRPVAGSPVPVPGSSPATTPGRR
ncbi:MFS transporter, partial [Streptomyces albidoflavus]